MKYEIFTLIDILGTVAFSISGVFAAMEKKVDIFGIYIIAFITAIGGGTIRDVIIGDLPVSWMRTGNYSLVIFLSASVAMLFHKFIRNYEKILLLFDAIGVGFFTILGIKKGVDFGFSPGMCVALGTITACFGGLVRDVVLNQIPQLFHKEIYATPCIAGGIIYLLLNNKMPANYLDILCIAIIVTIRMFAIKYNWRLPVIAIPDQNK